MTSKMHYVNMNSYFFKGLWFYQNFWYNIDKNTKVLIYHKKTINIIIRNAVYFSPSGKTLKQISGKNNKPEFG